MNKPNVTIPKERILLHRHQMEVDMYRGYAQQIQRALNQFLDEFKKLNVELPTIPEIRGILGTKSVKAAENLVREKVAGNESVSVQGIKLNRAKLMEMVEIPDCNCLNKEFSNLYNVLIRTNQTQIKTDLSAVRIVDGVAQLNEQDIAAFTEQYSTYAETDEEKEAYLLCKQIAEQLDYVYTRFRFGPVAHRIIEQGERGYPFQDRRTTIDGKLLKNAIGKYSI